MHDGATWTYAVGSGGIESRTIVGSTTFNGLPVKVLRDQSGNERYFTNDAAGLRWHGAFFPDPVESETDTYSPPVALLPQSFSVGSVAYGSGTIFVQLGALSDVFNYASSSTALAIEPVTVPAGAFAGALRVRLRIDITHPFGAIPPVFWIFDTWHVPGIGVVRESFYDSYDDSTETWDLQSYSVPDTIPDAFSFLPRTVELAFQPVDSDPATVSGLAPSVSAEISVTGGAYQINGGSFVTAPGTVVNGDQVRVRVQSGSPGFSTSATLDIGGVTASFVVTTAADVSPDPFSFPAVSGAPLGITLYSPLVAITGINAAVPISIVGGEYSVVGQPFTSAPGMVSPFYSVEVRMPTAGTLGTTTTATLTVGGVSADFSATTFTGTQGANSILYYASPAGDYIGDGRTRVVNIGPAAPAAVLTIARGFTGGINSQFDEPSGTWRLELDAPGDASLAPGRYAGAVRFPFHGEGAGLTFSGHGRGCNMLTGHFDVLEVGYAADGSVQRLAVNFEQSCEGFMPPLLGEFRFNSAIPLGSQAIKRSHADANGDGRSDIFWRNAATGENYLYPMNGTTVLGTEGYLRTVADPDWRVAKIGDFDGDGKADILWRNGASGENYVYLMNGTTIAGEGYLRTVADQNWQVAGTGDFDGDGKADVLWRNMSTGENYLYLMDGATLAGEGYLRTVADQNWQVTGIGDFDGDGKDDVLWRNGVSGENYLYPMNGLVILGTEGYVRTVADQSWQVAGVGDFTGDGKADILWRNAASGENYLYPMSGTTILGTEGYIRTVADTAWQVKGTGDYDGDGKADVLWRNALTGENYLYPMDGTAIKPSGGYLRTVPQPDWRIQ
jgi:hypothetical protein